MTTVTGTFRNRDGSPAVNETVDFTALAVTVDSEAVYPKDVLTGTTNESGYFSVTLTPGNYQVRIPDGTLYRVGIADGPPIDLVTLLELANEAISQNALLTIINNNNRFIPTILTGGPYVTIDTDEFVYTEDTANPISLLLDPLIGYSVIIANGSDTENLIVTPSGANTIKGGNTRVIFPNRAAGYICFRAGEYFPMGGA